MVSQALCRRKKKKTNSLSSIHSRDAEKKDEKRVGSSHASTKKKKGERERMSRGKEGAHQSWHLAIWGGKNVVEKV